MNVGDLLENITAGRFQATRHRVRIPEVIFSINVWRTGSDVRQFPKGIFPSGNLSSVFFRVTTSQMCNLSSGNFWQLPKCAISQVETYGHFSNVQFVKWKLLATSKMCIFSSGHFSGLSLPQCSAPFSMFYLQRSAPQTILAAVLGPQCSLRLIRRQNPIFGKWKNYTFGICCYFGNHYLGSHPRKNKFYKSLIFPNDTI